MNDKSHVSLEQHACLVCGMAFDTGTILLDRRLRQTMQPHTTTGWSLCAEHARLFEDGFIALVECDPKRSGLAADDATVKPGQAFRTGRVAQLRREAFTRLFDKPAAAGQPCVFVDPGVLEMLQLLASKISN